VAFLELPASAAWEHRGARTGVEVAYVDRRGDEYVITGCTAAVEDGEPWIVDYAICVDRDWTTRRAETTHRSRDGVRTVRIDRDRDGAWQVNGQPAPPLSGCFDVDLESSSLTNTFPVHRLSLRTGERADAPAAYVRANDGAVERLEQSYECVDDSTDAGPRYWYVSPAFEFAATLTYDRSGLVIDYPGIAKRLL
jgi:uncharacterized protein